MKPRERILRLLALTGHQLAGSEIAGICGLWSWRFYMAICGLENDGLVTSEWAYGEKPRKRMYRLKTSQ